MWEFCQRSCAHLTYMIKLWLSRVIGQVQSRQCIEEVIRFAKEEHLFLMADEVIHLNSDVFHSRFLCLKKTSLVKAPNKKHVD